MSTVFSSWKNLRRTPYQSLTALMVVITTFFMVFVFSTFLHLGNKILNYFETRPQILVFFKTEVTDEQATAEAELLSKLEQVETVTITGKNDAFISYKEENQDEPLLLELLTPDLFPVSLSVNAKTPEGLSQIRQEIEKLDGIDTVDYRQDVIEEFLGWTNLIRNIGLFTCALFAMQFILVIMVITGMKVASRRRSINIMSILGANRSTIKGTFIRESMWLGLVGSLIAFGLSYLLLWYATPAISGFLGEIQVLPLTWQFLLIQAVAGCLGAVFLAAFSAWLSTTRLIKK
ncbi:MAG: permease-like cell division protein FtsX [bacterium]|nr:permease-like cell division protein FtsX [bacterium]